VSVAVADVPAPAASSPSRWQLALRWVAGVLAPPACFWTAGALFETFPWDGTLPRAGTLGFALVCVVAMAWATGRAPRSARRSAVLAGVFVSGVLFALVHAVATLLFAWVLLFLAPFFPLVLAPVPAVWAYAAAAIDELERCRLHPPLRFVAWLALGMALPFAAGWGANAAAQRAESVVLARHVDADDARDPARLARLRPLAWMHEWDRLADRAEQEPDPALRERAHRALLALGGPRLARIHAMD